MNNKTSRLRLVISSIIGAIINSIVVYFFLGSDAINVPKAFNITMVLLPIFIIVNVTITFGTFMLMEEKKK